MNDVSTRETEAAAGEPEGSGRRLKWLFPLLRVVFLVAAAWLVWYVAGHWNRWTGAARLESTDDAFVNGDVTPLSARISGYITQVAVNDFQRVKKGDLIAVIDPSDYEAQLELAKANLAAAQATLANLSNQRDVQNALTDHRNSVAVAAAATRHRVPRSTLRSRLNDT